MLTLYETYYKLSADPFRLSPDHRFSFGHRSYSKAKAYLEYALHRGEGFITITGSAGTGKTTLISEILAELDKSRLQVATLSATQLEGKDLLQMLAALFGLEYEDESKTALLIEIEEFLKQLNRKGRRAVLIVDEAQGLSPGALEELRLLANLQVNHRLLLQVFLVGQEQLRDVVRAPGMEHLRQRIVAASHLEPLNLDESISYIEHRLNRVGWAGDPSISEDALRLVHKFSAGVPRRVNLICSRLFLYGSMEQKHQLDGADASTVIEDLQQELLISPEAVDVQADAQEDPDRVDGGQAPVRRLPREQRQAQDETSSGEPGPAELGASAAAGTEDESDVALRERDIWGEIEHLERELQDTAEGMKDAEAVRSGRGARPRSVAATGSVATKASVHALQRDAVGAAVHKAVSRSLAAGSPARHEGEQRRGAATRVRGARQRLQTVPVSATEVRVDEDIRPALRAERGDAAQRSRHQAHAAKSRRRRRWTLLFVTLAIGIGFAGTIGWQNRDRLSSEDTDRSGTIRRDVDAKQPSALPQGNADAAAVSTGAPTPEAAPAVDGQTAPVAAAQAGNSESAQPPVDVESARQIVTALSAPTHVAAVADSESSVSAAVKQDTSTVPVDAHEGLKVQTNTTDAVVESEGATATPAQIASPEPAAVAVADDVASTEAAVAASPAAAEPSSDTSGGADSVQTERARLRREAEQRFKQQLDQNGSKATTPRKPPPRERKTGDDVLPAKTATASAAAMDSGRSVTQSVAASTASSDSVRASRPKTATASTRVAAAPTKVVVSEPVRSSVQIRTELLQGQWTSRGKPATLLPSEITFCSSAGSDINCWSIPQKTDTKYGKALYKVEAKLGGINADGRFRLSYRTLVKLVDSGSVPDSTPGGAADDDAGWQVTERSMECELSKGDTVQCRGANGTVRDYRKVSAGKRLR